MDGDPANERPEIAYLPELLGDLMDSMRSAGLQERIKVYARDGRYLVSSGHRRVAAARALGWTTIPAIIEPAPADASSQDIARLASNLCRADIDPIGYARGVQRMLATIPGLTQARLGEMLGGRSQSAIANAIRLLELPPAVIALLEAGKLAAGHGEALLRITEPELGYVEPTGQTAADVQRRYATRAVEQGYSVTRLREDVQGWHEGQKYRKLDIARNAKWRAERVAQAAAAEGVKPPEPTPEERAQAAAAAAEAAKEAAAKARHADRLIERASHANVAIDLAVGYQADAAPNMEMLRLAAAMCVEGAHVDTHARAAWLQRIDAAPDTAALLVIMAAAARAGLQLDADKRAIYTYHFTSWLTDWMDRRWYLSVRIADTLLARRLINRTSHATLTERKPRPPAPAPAERPAAFPPAAADTGKRLATACPGCGTLLTIAGAIYHCDDATGGCGCFWAADLSPVALGDGYAALEAVGAPEAAA